MVLIKIVSLFFGFLFLLNPFLTIYARNNNEKVPFDVNQVIEPVVKHSKPHNTDPRLRFNKNPHPSENLQGEFMIDTTRFFTPGGYEASAPSITFDGTNYFVVWGDYNREAVMGARVNETGEILDKPPIKIATAYGEWEGDKPAVAYGDGVYLSVWADYRSEIIFGARTSITGVPLDTVPIPICTTNYYGYQPSVAYGDSNFLVVWFDYADVIGARVSPAGVVLDTLGFIISAAINDQYEPTVCFGGSNYFVVWTDDRSATNLDIYGTRVNIAGVVLDPTGIRISNATDREYHPVLTFGGSNYFVVWEVHEEYIYGARIDQNGTVLDTASIAVSPAFYPSWFPSVTFDGVNYFAVWGDVEEENLYGTRIDTNGIILDTGRIKICTSTHEMYYPSVVFGGSYSLVVWDDSRIDFDIFGARINNAGIVLDSAGIPVSYSVNNQQYSKVGFDGTNYLVVWEISTEDGTGIYGARVSPTGVILDSTGISISPTGSWKNYSQVIFGGSNYLVVWQQRDTNFNYDIYGIRVSPSGSVLDTTIIPISTAISNQMYPQAIFDGNNYFVVWTDIRNGNDDIYGARVSSSGIVLDPEGIPISTANDEQSGAQVFFDGTNYLVLWEDSRNGGYDSVDIYGARVNTSGVVLDTAGIPISTAYNRQVSPQVAFDGTNYLLVWDDERTGIYYDIYGARITTAGVVLDPTGIPISIANNDQYNTHVVFGDNKYFVVWQDFRNGNYDIYGARLTTEGLVLDSTGIPISIGDYQQTFPQVVFDGAYYVLVWQSGLYGWGDDIYGARVNPVSARIDSFPITTQPELQNYPTITHGPNNQVFVTYTGWADVYQGKSYYTDRIWGKFVPASGIEETKISAEINSPIFMSIPNPFNRSTTIKYSVRKSGDVTIKIFDIAGKLVRNLVNGNKKPGAYSINWDGTDDLKKKLPAGVYFYRLKVSDGNSETKELIILR
jgi:hypothetical protein